MTHKMEIIAALHSFTIKYYPFKCLFSQWMCIYPNTHICMITSTIALYSMYETLALCYLTLCLRLPFSDCNLLDILPYFQSKKNMSFYHCLFIQRHWSKKWWTGRRIANMYYFSDIPFNKVYLHWMLFIFFFFFAFYLLFAKKRSFTLFDDESSMMLEDKNVSFAYAFVS